LVPSRAIINRYGFNSEGIVAVAKRLGAQHGKRRLAESTREPPRDSESRLGGKAGPGILGVNLGKNKTSEDSAADYVQGVHTLSQYADYLVGCNFTSLLVFLHCCFCFANYHMCSWDHEH
jgi:dihydroorotate dehydrogenase